MVVFDPKKGNQPAPTAEGAALGNDPFDQLKLPSSLFRDIFSAHAPIPDSTISALAKPFSLGIRGNVQEQLMNAANDGKQLATAA